MCFFYSVSCPSQSKAHPTLYPEITAFRSLSVSNLLSFPDHLPIDLSSPRSLSLSLSAKAHLSLRLSISVCVSVSVAGGRVRVIEVGWGWGLEVLMDVLIHCQGNNCEMVAWPFNNWSPWKAPVNVDYTVDSESI